MVSSLSFFQIYSQAFSTGIAVKSETASNDTMASSPEISRLATWSANSIELEAVTIAILDGGQDVSEKFRCVIAI